MKGRLIYRLALALLLVAPSFATPLAVGVLSFDVFIPSAGQTTGVNAFNIYNFTGPVYGPILGEPYAADALSFLDTTLTLNVQGGPPQVINLGTVGPGILLDGSGNPLVQVPSATSFTSATLQATLSATSFLLSDGTTFIASPSVTLNLTPSAGPVLVAGVDLQPLFAQPAGAVVPEPGTMILIGSGLAAIGLAWRKR